MPPQTKTGTHCISPLKNYNRNCQSPAADFRDETFSMGKYSVFLFLSVAAAIGCGILFSLRWHLILGMKQLKSALSLLSFYVLLQLFAHTTSCSFFLISCIEHRRFLDVSDYMEQILYSFRLNPKILLSLKDTRTLFTEGRITVNLPLQISGMKQLKSALSLLSFYVLLQLFAHTTGRPAFSYSGWL